jgi:DNA-binding beta-propeller fold protein YncE
VTLRSQSAQVTPRRFATGAAPNDIAYSGSSLYVANSMDNTVVRYSLTGASEATHSFAQFASPSFVTVSGNAVWIVCNGDNTLTGLSQSALAPLSNALFKFTGSEAFIGPAAPLVIGTSVYVPRNQITSFGPTVYGSGRVSRCDFAAQEIDSFSTFGRNPGFCAFDSARRLLFVVCTGEIQFDESWSPFANSDGFLEIYDVLDDHRRIATINLGRTGPQRIALSPDGRTVWLASALNGNLYKVDIPSRTVERGAANPLVLTAEPTYISDVQYSPSGRWLLATSFNTDELYVIDPETDTVNAGPYPAPFDLDGQPALLSGAQRMALGPAVSDGSSARVYVVMGIANCVASVDLF